MRKQLELRCVDRLIKHFSNNRAEVGRHFNRERATIWHWEKVGLVPAKYAYDVEVLTKGKIKAKDILMEHKAREKDYTKKKKRRLI